MIEMNETKDEMGQARASKTFRNLADDIVLKLVYCIYICTTTISYDRF